MARLDDDQIKVEAIRYQQDGLSLRQIEDILGINRTSLSDFFRRKSYKNFWATYTKPIASGTYDDHHRHVEKLKGNTFILTSAQNSTFVHGSFLRSLEQMADRLDAQIIVGTFSYNLNGFQNLEKSDGEWFDPKIKDYILDEPAILADGLMWCGELNILPTAANPLSGFHSYTKSGSGIIPHVKVQLESLPRHKTKDPRFLYTTGAVTKRNYVQKKAGQKASFHHVFGALLVEVDQAGDWFVRQLIADSDSGEFYDLDTLYTPYGYTTGHNAEAINWGDIHAEKMDEEVCAGAFASDNSLIDLLRPQHQFVHDVLDHSSRNHHNIKDPYFRFISHHHTADSVEADIDRVAEALTLMDRSFCKTVVVESNHDLALKRWLKESDYKTDPNNALLFLKLQLGTYEALYRGDFSFNVLEYAINLEYDLRNVLFLKTDESYLICGEAGIECGSHGHLGNNGARGSILSYTKLGTRFNIGHSHTAAIRDGVYCAGVMASLDMGYNQGGTTWSHSVIVTYPNGKRTIITMRGSKYAKNQGES